MIGVVINTLVVAVGSIIGLLVGKKLPKRLSDTVMSAIGLCTLYIGISGVLKCKKDLVLIISMALGTFLGSLIDIDAKLNSVTEKAVARFNSTGENRIAQGFVNATLLFCVGAMAIIGSLSAGLSGDISILLEKTVLDGVAAVLFSATLGVGVIFSAVSVFIYQGLIVLLATPLNSLLTDAMIVEIGACGSLMIVAIGLNILGVTKIKTANLLPAIIFVPFLCNLL